MGCPTVNKFLCCISLETGGLIIGWFNIILSFLVLIGLISTMSVLIVAGNHEDVEVTDSAIYITVIVMLSLFIAYYCIVFLASILLVRGTRKRDHSNMVLFMILMAVGVIFQFLQLLSVSLATILSAIFFAFLSLYFFLCIYSLYDMLKKENTGRSNA